MAKSRLIKTYESFMLNRKFKYEQEVIDPILELIRDNQEQLTQPDKLPQLSKLGYMFNILWYAGRICWGGDGLLLDPSVKKAIKDYDWEDEPAEEDNPYQFTSCENNPRDKIEMCDPETEEIGDLIYGAWSQHIIEGREGYPDYAEFSKLVKEGKPLTDLEKKELKINKTFDDWVEIKLDPTYKYKTLYPDRKSVAISLLCTIGTGYILSKDGFIIEEASGADQDKAIYGDWQNSKFDPEYASVIDRILAIPEVKETLDTTQRHMDEIYKKEEAKRKRWGGDEDDEDDVEFSRIMAKKKLDLASKPKVEYQKPYSKYYPISSSSTIFKIGNKEAQVREGIRKIDQSYIDASIEVCKDIMAHKDKEEKGNVEFAQEFLGNMGVDGYGEFVKKPEFDKYELLSEIKDIFTDFTDEFGDEEEQTTNRAFNCWKIWLNDTAKSGYGDNNYYMRIHFAKNTPLPIGVSKSIDILSGQPFYKDLKNALDRVKTISEIKLVTFDYSNIPNGGLSGIDIGFFVSKYEYKLEEEKSDEYFISQGFQIGGNNIILPIDNMNLVARKPKTLGSKHPMNKTGKEYFSNSLSFEIYSTDWKKLVAFQLDERNFNSIHCNHKPAQGVAVQINDWILKEHEDMKKSDPGYGFGKKEGSKCLYVHDFMLWLKDHQNNLKK